MSGTYFKKGSYNICCDVCNKKVKSTEIKKRWDGLMVCPEDFEHDHPQKYIRVRSDGVAVPVIRERGEGVNLLVCNVITSSAYADYSTADCAQADNTTIPYATIVELALSVPEGTF